MHKEGAPDRNGLDGTWMKNNIKYHRRREVERDLPLLNILQAWVYVVLRPLRIIKSYIPDLGNLRAFSLEVDPELRPPPPPPPSPSTLSLGEVAANVTCHSSGWSRERAGVLGVAPRATGGFARCPQQTAMPECGTPRRGSDRRNQA